MKCCRQEMLALNPAQTRFKCLLCGQEKIENEKGMSCLWLSPDGLRCRLSEIKPTDCEICLSYTPIKRKGV